MIIAICRSALSVFDLVVPLPGIGPLLLARRTQWLARSMLLDSVYDPNALTEEDVEVFLAPLREPARARALSPADKLDRPDGERRILAVSATVGVRSVRSVS